MVTIATARYSYRGADRVDTTRYHKGADTWGLAFAPPRWLLDVAKGYAGALARLPRGVELPPTTTRGSGRGTRGTTGRRCSRGTARARHRGRTARHGERLLAMESATVVCFCGSPEAPPRTTRGVRRAPRGDARGERKA